MKSQVSINVNAYVSEVLREIEPVAFKSALQGDTKSKPISTPDDEWQEKNGMRNSN